MVLSASGLRSFLWRSRWWILALGLVATSLAEFIAVASSSFTNLPLAFGDVNPPYASPAEAGRVMLSYWSFQGGGHPGSTLLYTLFISLPVAVASIQLVQAFMLLLPIPVAGVGFYFFARVWGAARAMAVGVASVYAVNAVTLTYLIAGSSFSTLTPSAMTPWVGYFLVRYFDNGRRLSDLSATALTWAIGTWWNPQFTVWAIPVVLFLFFSKTWPLRSKVLLSPKSWARLAGFAVLFTGLTYIVNITFVNFLSAYTHGGSVGNDIGPPNLFAVQVTGNFLSQLQPWMLIADLLIATMLALGVGYVHDSNKKRAGVLSSLAQVGLLGIWFGGIVGYPPSVLAVLPFLASFEPWFSQLILNFLFSASVVVILTDPTLRLRLLSPTSSPDAKPERPAWHIYRTRVGSYALGAAVVLGVASVQLVSPLVVGSLQTPPFAEVLGSHPNLAQASIPPSVSEFRNWILSADPGDPLAGILWVPLNPYSLSALQYYIPTHQVLLPDSTAQNSAILEPAVNGGSQPGWASTLAGFGVEYVVVNKDDPTTSSALFNAASSYQSWRQGPVQSIVSGPQWNLVYYPGGSPQNWTDFLNIQSNLQVAFSNGDFTVYANEDYLGSIAAFSVANTSLTAKTLFNVNDFVSVSYGIVYTDTYAGNLVAPALLSTQNGVLDSNFTSGMSGWQTESSSTANVSFSGTELRITTAGSGSATVSQSVGFASDESYVFAFDTATVGTNGSQVALIFRTANNTTIQSDYPEFNSLNFYGPAYAQIPIVWIGTAPLNTTSVLIRITSHGNSTLGLPGTKIFSQPRLFELTPSTPLARPSYELSSDSSLSVNVKANGETLLVFLTDYDIGWTESTPCGSIASTPFAVGVRTINLFFNPAGCSTGTIYLVFGPTQAWHVVIGAWEFSAAVAVALVVVGSSRVRRKRFENRHIN